MQELNLTDEQIDEYLSVALSNADRVGPEARNKLHGLLKYYAKKKHPFEACVRDNRKRFGPRAEAVCAVLKDIIRGTTKWRGKNNPRDHGVSAAAMSQQTSSSTANIDYNQIAFANAQRIRESGDFVLNIPEDIQYYLDEIDDEYIEAIIKADEVQLTEETKDIVEANMSDEPQLLAEMFFDGTDEKVYLGDDGLIYKTVLREGEWKYSPGPGQVPINKPIKVIKEGTSDGRSRIISMKELKENFDSKIKDHVTIPLSHDNKVDENTGYIREIRIGEDETGRAILEAGFDFTEPDIKGKVERGTIANTSAGVLFDYIHKESGKKFNAVLDHAALTNSPWLNGMKPFGIEASDNLEVVSFSEEIKPTINTGGEVMPEQTTEETTEVVTPEDTLATKLGLSEDEITSRLAEYEELKAKDKKHAVEAQITEWQNEGVTPAVLSEAKTILMADDGAVVLNLSEDGASKPQTASQLVERLVSVIPKVDLTDEPGTGEKQATEGSKPDDEEENPYADLSLAEKTEISNMVLFERVPEEEAVAQVRAKREKK